MLHYRNEKKRLTKMVKKSYISFLYTRTERSKFDSYCFLIVGIQLTYSTALKGLMHFSVRSLIYTYQTCFDVVSQDETCCIHVVICCTATATGFHRVHRQKTTNWLIWPLYIKCNLHQSVFFTFLGVFEAWISRAVGRFMLLIACD